jgi:hypothetical protein
MVFLYPFSLCTGENAVATVKVVLYIDKELNLATPSGAPAPDSGTRGEAAGH